MRFLKNFLLMVLAVILGLSLLLNAYYFGRYGVPEWPSLLPQYERSSGYQV